MNRLIAIAAVSTFAAVGALPAIAPAAQPVPCEKMLTDLRAAMGQATLKDVDKAKGKDLEGKGLERCKADDDAGADAFFEQALKMVGK